MTQPHSEFIIHPNGQSTHYILDDFTDPWRPSETILIQHGFARHSAFWYHWIPVLSRQYRVVRRDARGHGLSSVPPSSSKYAYTIDTILEEIVDTLNQLGLEKVHFLGESTSGEVGVALAAKYPQRLLSLTLCSSPTVMSQSAQEMIAFGEKDWETACRTLGAKGWCEALNKLPGTMAHPDPAYYAWWLEQVGVSSGEGFAGYAKFLSTLDVRPLFKDVDTENVPVLILAPARSRMTSILDQESQRDQIKGAIMVVIDGKGHEIYVDRAEDCQKALLKFLGDLRK